MYVYMGYPSIHPIFLLFILAFIRSGPIQSDPISFNPIRSHSMWRLVRFDSILTYPIPSVERQAQPEPDWLNKRDESVCR